MVSLAYTADDIKEEKKEMQPGNDMPKYPWGLSISLDQKTLEKLGKTATDFEPGDNFTIPVKMEVTGLNIRKNADGESYSCVDLQITDIDMGGTKSKSDEAVAKTLYDKTDA